MVAPVPAESESRAASPDAPYLVEADGTTVRLQILRPPLGPLPPFVFVIAVAASTALGAAGAPCVLVWVTGIIALLSVFFMFDTETYRGRRRVRRTLVLRLDPSGEYRTRGDVHVEVDGEGPASASDARLVFLRWTQSVVNSRTIIASELCLVAGRRVYIVAAKSAAGDAAEQEAGDPSHAAGDPSRWRARTVHGLAIALLEATEGRLPVEPTALKEPDVYRPPFSPWPTEVFSQVLTVLCATAVFAHALALQRAAISDWRPAAYLGLFAMTALPAPSWWHASRTSARAPALLRSMYGDVEPFPRRGRWRALPTLLLALTLPVAFSLGWLKLFPQMFPW